jgi:hypothetical protein
MLRPVVLEPRCINQSRGESQDRPLPWEERGADSSRGHAGPLADVRDGLLFSVWSDIYLKAKITCLSALMVNLSVAPNSCRLMENKRITRDLRNAPRFGISVFHSEDQH